MSDRSKIGTFLFEGGANKILGTAGTVLGAVQQIDSMYRTQPINQQDGGEQAKFAAELQRLQAEAAREEEEKRRRKQQQMLMYGGVAVVVLILFFVITKKK